jgi:hypothetical protein
MGKRKVIVLANFAREFPALFCSIFCVTTAYLATKR